MTPIVEHKDCIRRVRDDQAIEHVACVPCKGRGYGWRREGGNLWALGWEVHRECCCGHCGGAGIWKVS